MLHRCRPWVLAALLLFVSVAPGWTAGEAAPQKAEAAQAQAPEGSEPTLPAAPIEITADRLVSDTQNHLARFEGNVKAVQGETTIEADRLEVYYKEDADIQRDSAAEAGDDAEREAGALSKIAASGNVRIKFDNRLAVTDEAVYITDQRILTLTGSPARVTSGKDQVSGTVIKFYRDSGRIEVQGDRGKPVEAIFHSGEKGIQ